jgi:cytidine deaminase
VTHGREKECQPYFVLDYRGGLFLDFHHEDAVLFGVEASKAAQILIELITKNDNQIPDAVIVFSGHGESCSPCSGCSRQKIGILSDNHQKRIFHEIIFN